MRLWSIFRNGQFVGTLRAKTAELAVQAYAKWASCQESELVAK